MSGTELTKGEIFGSKKDGTKARVSKELLTNLQAYSTKFGIAPVQAMAEFVSASNHPVAQQQPDEVRFAMAFRRCISLWFGRYGQNTKQMTFVPVNQEMYFSKKGATSGTRSVPGIILLPTGNEGDETEIHPATLVQQNLVKGASYMVMRPGRAYQVSARVDTRDPNVRMKTLFVEGDSHISDAPMPSGLPEDPADFFLGNDSVSPMADVYDSKRNNASFAIQGFVAGSGTRSRDGVTQGWVKLWDDSMRPEDAKALQGGIYGTGDSGLAVLDAGTMIKAFGRANQYNDKSSGERRTTFEIKVWKVVGAVFTKEGGPVPNPGKPIVDSPLPAPTPPPHSSAESSGDEEDSGGVTPEHWQG